jgi:hypothetical protein
MTLDELFAEAKRLNCRMVSDDPAEVRAALDAKDAEIARLKEHAVILASTAEHVERAKWEEAMRLTWQMVDPLKPAGTPGSYWRGQDAGIVAALTTLRANLKTPN